MNWMIMDELMLVAAASSYAMCLLMPIFMAVGIFFGTEIM